MNYADARRVTTRLEALGYEATPRIDEADVILLETCTVRQQSEDKAYNKLANIGPLKKHNPDVTVAVMGCVVGVRGNEALEQEFPFVDVFMEPATSGEPLVSHLLQNQDLQLELASTQRQHLLLDGEVILPAHEQNNVVSAPVSIVEGCSHACSFCIIPQRRGIERSRPVGSIVAEVRSLVRQGVKEVVLLGQIVDRYGYDVADGPGPGRPVTRGQPGRRVGAHSLPDQPSQLHDRQNPVRRPRFAQGDAGHRSAGAGGATTRCWPI